MGTKSNPGQFDCYAKLEPDEPHFVLRGKDPVGAYLVSAWVALRAGDLDSALKILMEADSAWKASCRTNLPRDSEKSIEAEQCAKQMLDWYLAKRLKELKELYHD